MKNSYVFYRSYFEAIQDLKDKDKLKVYEAISELALNDKETNLNGISNTIFKLIKPQIVANNERYENGVKFGGLGGRPKEYDHNKIESLINNGLNNNEIVKEVGCSLSLVKNIRQKLGQKSEQKLGQELDNKSKTVKNTNENENENENVNVNENENVLGFLTTPQFLTPTLEEIISYGSASGATKEYCENFYNHYEGIGWVNGNGIEIKNWKVVFNNWFEKDNKKNLVSGYKTSTDKANDVFERFLAKED